MKLAQLTLPLSGLALLPLAGCASRGTYYAPAYVPPPPPPPVAYYSAPPLIVRAGREGFRLGSDDGARDAYNGLGHHPTRDRKFHDTPGYDPALGPYQPYRDAFRKEYLRGYDLSFYRR